MSCKNSTQFYFTAKEDEKLIEEVSAHQALYDLQDPNYKDQRVKDNIWVVVGEEVGRPVSECKKRWKNIRDTHDRRKREHSRTGSEAPPCKKGKKWQLEEQLSFLHTANVKRKSFCNISQDLEHHQKEDENEEKSEENEEHEDNPSDVNLPEIEQEHRENSELPRSQPISQKEVPRKHTTAKNQHEQQKQMTYRDKITFAMEKRSKERDVMIKNILEKDDEEDEISLFYKSIIKSVKNMPPHLQRRAKMETLTVISNIQSEMYPSLPGSSLTTATNPDIQSDVSVASSSVSSVLQNHDNEQYYVEYELPDVATLFTTFKTS